MSIVIVGEFPTRNEAGNPFSNGLWRYFKALLSEAGINPRECVWLNVMNKPASGMFAFTQSDKRGAYPHLPYIVPKAYLRMEFANEIGILYAALQRIKPNLILSVGDMPFWALTRGHGLEKSRGRITTALPEAGGFKLLPVLHPRAVQADISQEPILKADLRKAARQAAFPEVRRPKRTIYLRPTLDDLEWFWCEHLREAPVVSVDIETKGPIITCIGFAPSAERVLVLPFFNEENPDGNYWAKLWEERLAWRFVKRVLERPEVTLLGQNFTYDIQYLLRKMGIICPGYTEDTMVLHHALQPEMRKSLGFQASVYTDEIEWKTMVKRRSADRGGKKEDDE